MIESDAARGQRPADCRVRQKDAALPFPDRRKVPRPPLAEIRRGGALNLLPPVVISGAVRLIELPLISVLGFVIYLS
jgi:hypothetical protein